MTESTPTTTNRTLRRLPNSTYRPREYLTEKEVDRLIEAARKRGRNGARDACAILLAYRHGLRAQELCQLRWSQIDLRHGRLHVNRAKGGIESVHPLHGIRDRDGISGAAVTRRLRAMGIRDKPIAAGSPWQNGYVERLIGTIRRECLDHMIVFGEAHLRRILAKYVAYYNESRIHRSLDKDAPFHRTIERLGVITSRPHPPPFSFCASLFSTG